MVSMPCYPQGVPVWPLYSTHGALITILYFVHPPSPGQAAIRGFQWLVTRPHITMTASTQGRPGLITPVTLIVITGVTQHYEGEPGAAGLKYEYCWGSNYEMSEKLVTFWNRAEGGLYKMICFIKHTSGCHTSLVAWDLICLCWVFSGLLLHCTWDTKQSRGIKTPGDPACERLHASRHSGFNSAVKLKWDNNNINRKENELKAVGKFSLCLQWFIPGAEARVLLWVWDHPWLVFCVQCGWSDGRVTRAGDGPCIKMPEITFPNLPWTSSIRTSVRSFQWPRPRAWAETRVHRHIRQSFSLHFMFGIWCLSFDKIIFQRSLIDCLGMTLYSLASKHHQLLYLLFIYSFNYTPEKHYTELTVGSFQCSVFPVAVSDTFDVARLITHNTWYPHPTQHGAVISLSRGWR